MTSSEEEEWETKSNNANANNSSGFSLNLFKYNVRSTTTNRHRRYRHGGVVQRSNPGLGSSQNKQREQPSLGGATTTTTTKKCSSSSDNDNSKTDGTGTSSSQTKKRSRKDVILASISANTRKRKRLPIPIPSFKIMMSKTKTEDSHKMKKLSRLERAFFDDDDDIDDDDENDTNSNGNGKSQSDGYEQVDPKATKKTDGNYEKRKTKNKHENSSSLLSSLSLTNKSNGICRSKNNRNTNNLSIIVEHDDTDETESENSDCGEELFSSIGLDNRPKSKEQEQNSQPKPKPSHHVQESQITKTIVGKTKTAGKDDLKENSENKFSSVSSIREGLMSETVEAGGSSKLGDGEETEENDDSNFIDFGGDEDGSYDCNMSADGNDQEESRTNGPEKNEPTTNTMSISSSTKPVDESRQEPQQPSSTRTLFDFEREIDQLFLKTDTNTITMKMFCKTLERRFGAKPLDKASKKKVKARIMSLLKGEIIPSVDCGGDDGDKVSRTSEKPNENQDIIEGLVEKRNDKEHSKTSLNVNVNASTANITVLGKGSEENNTSKNDKHPIIETQPVVEARGEVIVVIDEQSDDTDNTTLSRKKNQEDNTSKIDMPHPIMESQPTAEIRGKAIVVIDKQPSSDISQNGAKKKRVNESRKSATPLDMPHAMETQPVVETGGEMALVIFEESSSHKSKKESKKKKTKESNKSVTGKKENEAIREPKISGLKAKNRIVKNKPKPTSNSEGESEKRTNRESDKNKPTGTTSEEKRPIKSKPNNKLHADGKSAANGGASTVAAKQSRPRKRTRKAQVCALCKTCPCQRTHDTNKADNIATLEITTFSRSDGAIEKTLIRRLQKLEKSTESSEEQTEIVRRRLKKHRRDVWKRAQQRDLASTVSAGAIAGKTVDSYFLPDAEIFERQQNESQGLPRKIVEKAQVGVFQKVPTYQPTLFEVMGISRDNDKTKQNIDNDVSDAKESQCKGKAGILGNEINPLFNEENNENDVDDDDLRTEYVPERECNDRIHRLEWNNGARDNTNEEIGTPSGSIFDTILTMTQEHEGGTDDSNMKEDKPVPLWDDLFESKHDDKSKPRADVEAGLDDLLGLFGDGGTRLSKNDSNSIESSSEDENRVDVSLLSQDAQAVANELVSTFSSREKNRIEAMERSCPNWKENINFALMQKDPEDISEALENVRESRMRMQAQRKRILDAWESKNAAMEVFETALKHSAARLKSDLLLASHGKNGDAGFTTQSLRDKHVANRMILTQTEGGDN